MNKIKIDVKIFFGVMYKIYFCARFVVAEANDSIFLKCRENLNYIKKRNKIDPVKFTRKI